MAKAVSRQEVVEDNIFSNLRRETQEQIDLFDKLDVKVVEFSKNLKSSVKDLKFESSKDFTTLSKAVSDSNKMTKEAIQLEKEMANLRKVNAQATVAETRATEAQAKATNRQAKETENLNSAYKQESALLNKLRNEYKDLEVKKANGIKLTKEEITQSKKLKSEIDSLNAKLTKIDENAGQHFRKFATYDKAVNRLKTTITQLGLSFGVFEIGRKGLSVISEFQTSLAELSAITGVSGTDLDKLGDKSIELSKKYGTSASNINEALKLAGSARPELLKNTTALAEFTDKALILSKASGDDIQTSISNLAGTLNAFEEPSTKAAKTIDILANAAQLGTQEIPYLTDAFTKFGGVAKANNIGIAESAAAVEELGKKMPDASSAGVGLRNVMLKLSATKALPKEALSSLSKYGISLEGLEDKTKPFSERLKLLKPLLNDNAALVKIFGTENFLAAQTLIGGSEKIADFTKALDKNGTAQDQANIKSKTLAEAGGRLKAQFESLFLEFRNGSGALTTVIDFLAKNLGTIISLMTKLGALYLVFIARQKILNSEFTKGFKSAGTFSGGLKGMITNLKEGAKSGTGLGGALKGIGWTALIGLAFELATEMYNIASGAKSAADQINLLNALQAQSGKLATANIDKLKKETQEKLNALEREKKERLANGEDEKKVNENIENRRKNLLESEKERLKGYKKIANEKLANERKAYKETSDIYEEFKKLEAERSGAGAERGVGQAITIRQNALVNSLKATAKQFGIEQGFWESNKDFIERVAIASRDNMVVIKERISLYDTEIESLNELILDQETEIKVIGKSTDITKDKVKHVKELNTQLEQLNEYTSNYTETLRKLQEQQEQDDINQLTRDIEKYIQAQKDRIDTDLFFNEEQLREMLQKKNEMLTDQAISEKDFQIKTVEEKYNEIYTKELEAIEKNRYELLKQEGLTAAEKEKINKSYEERLAELRSRQPEMERDKAAEILAIENELEAKILDLVKDSNDEIKQSIQDLFDYRDSKKKDEVKTEEDALKTKEELIQMEMDLAKLLADYLIEQSNRRIKQLDDEISAAEKQADYFQELAKNGTIVAQQSYAAEQEVIREANLQKEKELQRQQRIKLAETVFNTYNTKLSDPKKSDKALSSTISDIGVLQAFINSMPKFFHGTEDTGSKGSIFDQYGAITGVTHANERVMTKDQNKELKGISNEGIVDIVKAHNQMAAFKKIDGVDKAGNFMDIAPMLKRLESIESAIQNNKTDYNFEKIVRGVGMIIKEEQRGQVRITTKNRFS